MVDAQKALAAQYLQTSLPILSQVMALEIRKQVLETKTIGVTSEFGVGPKDKACFHACQPGLHRPRVALLARLTLMPDVPSSLRLLRLRSSHEAGDVRQPAVAAARTAGGLDGRRARVEADDARSAVGGHCLRGESPDVGSDRVRLAVPWCKFGWSPRGGENDRASRVPRFRHQRH